jgi:hypothetical protein
MQVKNATLEQMSLALKELNKKYNGNIEFKRLERVGNKIIFTLKVKDRKALGTALSLSYYLHLNKGLDTKGLPKFSGSASWYAHGFFFEELLKVNSDAVIESTLKGKRVTIDINGGNWQNEKLGSDYFGYVDMSELTENEPEGVL